MNPMIYAGIPEQNKATFINNIIVVIKNVDYSKEAALISKEIEKYFGEKFQTYLISERRSRKREYCFPRQVFFWLFKRFTGVRNLSVSQHFGFNHGTLSVSQESIDWMYDRDKDFQRKIRLIEEVLKESEK